MSDLEEMCRVTLWEKLRRWWKGLCPVCGATLQWESFSMSPWDMPTDTGYCKEHGAVR